MKFLIDNQLPAALARHLQSWGFDCLHVLEAGLEQASDADICRYAADEDRIIISTCVGAPWKLPNFGPA